MMFADAEAVPARSPARDEGRIRSGPPNDNMLNWVAGRGSGPAPHHHK